MDYAMTAGRRSGPPPAAARATPGTQAKAFQIALAIYIALAVTKVHELSPFLTALQPAKVIGAALVALTLAEISGERMGAVFASPVTKWLWVIAALAVASIPGAAWPGLAFHFVTSDYWKTLLFFVITAAGMADRRTMSVCIKVFVICGSLIALRLLLGSGLSTFGRAFVSTAFDPNESALLFLTVIPFALALVSSKNAWKWVGYAAALVLVGGIVKTQSRGGFLGLLGVGGWLLYQARPGRRLVFMAAIAGGAAVVAVVADAETRARFMSVFDASDDYNVTNRDGRYMVWKRGIHFMAIHPLLGVGVENFPVADGTSGKRNIGAGIKYSAAHNTFVQIGAELGVLGLIAFIMMLWKAASGCRAVLRATLRSPPGAIESPEQESAFAFAALSGLVAFVIPAFFLSFAYNAVTYFLLAVCVAVRIGTPAALPSTTKAPVRRRVQHQPRRAEIRVRRTGGLRPS